METTKWKVKNTRLKEVIWSVWIYCAADYPDSFQSSIVPEDLAEKDVLFPSLAVSIRQCQAILPVPFIPSR